MELPREYLSYSQIRLYLICPRKYYLTYIREIPSPVNDKIFLGTLFHEVLENYFNQKLALAAPSLPEIREFFLERFLENRESRDIQWGIPQGTVRKRGLAFLEYFHAELADRFRPLMVEKELEAVIPELGIKMRGVIDLIEEDLCITDFKTTTSRWSNSRVRHSFLQMVIYRYLFEKNFDKGNSKLRFCVLFSKNGDRVRHQTLDFKPQDADTGKMVDTVSYVFNGIAQGDFPENRGFRCEFCELREQCRLL